MTVTRLIDGLRQARLRRAALRYAAHGWDVVPGAVRCGDRFRCLIGCPTTACHPDWTGWEQTTTHEPAWVAALWAFRPRAILLATGRCFDVLEVPAVLAVGAERGPDHGPVAVTGAGRWMFLVRPGAVLRPPLAERADVVLHGPGSWIPAPPTRTLEGPVRWLVHPEEASWRLPDAHTLQARLARALPSSVRRPLGQPRVA
jgi:hypothetical protein